MESVQEGGRVSGRRKVKTMGKEELFAEAKRLSKLVDTDYAETHAGEWERFEEAINEAYERGDITGTEFNVLATTAFYDYFELKEVGNED